MVIASVSDTVAVPLMVSFALFLALRLALLLASLLAARASRRCVGRTVSCINFSVCATSELFARWVGANPNTICVNSSRVATERIYLTLKLPKMSIIFCNFADESAKQLRRDGCSSSGAMF